MSARFTGFLILLMHARHDMSSISIIAAALLLPVLQRQGSTSLHSKCRVQADIERRHQSGAEHVRSQVPRLGATPLRLNEFGSRSQSSSSAPVRVLTTGNPLREPSRCSPRRYVSRPLLSLDSANLEITWPSAAVRGLTPWCSSDRTK